MQTPQLAICAVAVLMLFSSCQRENVLGSDQVPTPTEHKVQTRCCDDLTDDILGNRQYQEAWDNIHLGIIEPTVNILEALDTAYVFAVVRELETCILSGQPPEQCADAFIEALGVKEIIANLNTSLYDSLRLEYADIPDDQFYASLEEAFEASLIDLEENRDLPCFHRYQSAIRNITIGGLGKIFGSTSGLGAAVGTIVAAVKLRIARLDFCACLYDTYGTGC